MAERKESREISVEMLAGGRPRVLLDGRDVSDQVVAADGSVRINQPGVSMRIQANAGPSESTVPPATPEAPEPAPRAVELLPEDDAQSASVIQTQRVSVVAGGSVTIFLTQNAQVSQNQANLSCKKKKRRCC